jgi:hypothetical protein
MCLSISGARQRWQLHISSIACHPGYSVWDHLLSYWDKSSKIHLGCSMTTDLLLVNWIHRPSIVYLLVNWIHNSTSVGTYWKIVWVWMWHNRCDLDNLFEEFSSANECNCLGDKSDSEEGENGTQETIVGRIPSMVDEPVTGFDDANEMNDVNM